MEQTESGGSSRPKATWFCPDCGHESPVWGDWKVVSSENSVRTECPECATVIDERPAEGGDDGFGLRAAIRQVTDLVTTVPAQMLGLLLLQSRLFSHRH